MNQSSTIAELLLEINAIHLSPTEPYTWASGIKAPIYCDNRLIMSHPKERDQIETALAQLISQHYPEVEVIAGTATAGIPHAAFVAEKLNLPMIYVRSSNKGHGKQKAIEGLLNEGAKVVMVEDLISTGSSVLTAAEKVKEAGGKVLGCVAIFDYLLEAGRENFASTQIPLFTLTNYKSLIDVAVKRPELANHYDTLAAWYQNPRQWPNN